MAKQSTMNLSEIWNKAIAADPGNIDLKYAKDVFLNVSQQEMLDAFSRSVIERTDELRFMPDHLFNHYFSYFNDYVLDKKYSKDDADMVLSCYVQLLNEKLDSESIDSSHPLEQTKQTLDFIGKNIEYFFGETKIYGNPRKPVADLQKRFYGVLQREGLRP